MSSSVLDKKADDRASGRAWAAPPTRHVSMIVEQGGVVGLSKQFSVYTTIPYQTKVYEFMMDDMTGTTLAGLSILFPLAALYAHPPTYRNVKSRH